MPYTMEEIELGMKFAESRERVVVILNRMIRVGLIKKTRFEQRCEKN